MTPGIATPLTDDEIITHFRAGTLLSELQRSLGTTHQEELHERLASLHNAGSIDMLTLPARAEFREIDRSALFNIQQIYCGVIPRLEAQPLPMLEMVQRLATKQGTDGGAMLLHAALGRWVDQVPARAKEIIAAAQSDPGTHPEIVRVALVTLGDLNSARSLLEASDGRRQGAIAALGGIKPLNDQHRDEALTELVAIAAADPEMDMRITAIFATFNLLQHCTAHALKWIPRLVAAVTAAPSDATRTALLQGLWQHTGLFQTRDAEAALAVASGGDLSSGGLLGTLGATLSHLIGGNYHDLAIDCLTDLLSSDGRSLPLDSLQGVEYRLASLDQSTLFAATVRWFRTGDVKLCEILAKLLGPLHQIQPFDTTLAGYGLTGSQMIVLCHKAIGYMLLAPVMATSFVVAALRANDEAVQSDLTQLLLETLLINYGATVVMYLERIAKTDGAYGPVRKALRLYRTYEKGLNIGTPIKELSPSSYQRATVRQKHYVEGREIRKDAERQSVLSRLVHRSTVLYGRKVLSYARGSDRPPMSMEMNTIRSSFEMPKLHVIDPAGLDLLMMIFRASAPK